MNAFYIRAISQRLSTTLGLILLWRFLWKRIYTTLEALGQQDGEFLGLFRLQELNDPFWQTFFLIFLTFWFYRYSSGYFAEWYIAQLKLHEASVAGIRWVMLMIFNVIYPLIIALMMFWALFHYTSVPNWLKITTAWISFFLAVRRGWRYPRLKVSEIRFRLSFR